MYVLTSVVVIGLLVLVALRVVSGLLAINEEAADPACDIHEE